MNITITGNLGSGKTSVCRELEKAGFSIISAGDMFRQIAAEKRMTVIQLNEAAKKDRSIDDLLDSRSTELGKKMDHTVFDSRLAWHFVEKSFKVFLLADVREAARRVYDGDSRNAEQYGDMEQALEGLAERARLEQARFLELYGIDYYDAGNYDLIIESSCAAPEQIAQEIIRNFEQFHQRPFPAKTELNLKCMYPAGPFGKEEKSKSEAAGRCLNEEKGSQGLCMEKPVSITVKNGYNYLGKDAYEVSAAIAAGRVFAEIGHMGMQEASRAGDAVLTEDDICNFEQAGGFRYQENPLRVPVKPGYNLDFSRIFHQE